MAKYTINQITRATDKLFGAGFNTSRAILNMRGSDVIKLNSVMTKTELDIVWNLQKAIRTRKFIEFLLGEEIPEPKK